MTPTHCPYCALQCGMWIDLSNGKPEIKPRDFPTSRGGLCRKGWTAAQLLDHPDRLTTPLIRRSVRKERGSGLQGKGTAENGAEEFQPASWDEALELIATRIEAIQAESGPDAIAVFGGGGLTHEKAYALGKFARVVLRTKNIDYNGRYCMSSAAAAGRRAFGIDRGLPFPITDIDQAQCVMLVGANPAETMPPFMRHLRTAIDQAALIVVDPRRSPTADSASLHLQPSPGGDGVLALAMLDTAISEGLIDSAYIAERTTGFAAAATLARFWPAEAAERATGVPASDIKLAVRMLAAAPAAMILTGRGAEQHATGTKTVLSYINLALGLGLVGRPFSGYGTITGQGNGQGGREHGLKADQLPGYRDLADPVARREVAAVWGVDPDSLPGPGLSASELLAALGTSGGPRALLVHGSNPAVSAPASEAVRQRLRSLDLLVVADPFMSETAELADVVLPAAQWAEEDGHMTNLEGRVIARRKALAPPPGVWTDLRILAELSTRLRRPGFIAADPEPVFAELRRASAGGTADYSGVDPEVIRAGRPIYWPCPADTAGDGSRTLPQGPTDQLPAPAPGVGVGVGSGIGIGIGAESEPGNRSLGTARLFHDSFPLPGGLARFAAVDFELRPPPPDQIYLTSGRLLEHYQSGTQTRRVADLAKAAPEVYVEIHPELARQYGIEDQTSMRIEVGAERVVARARFTRSTRLDTIFMPFHWGGIGNVNRVVDDSALDPFSRMPQFKSTLVRISPAADSPAAGETAADATAITAAAVDVTTADTGAAANDRAGIKP